MALDRIYLDHAATTPVLPEARTAIAGALEQWANPSSPHAGGPPVGMRRARVGPMRERVGHRRLGFGKHRRGRGMVEINTVARHENSWIPVDCQLKRRPYIGAAAAAHPSADESDFYASTPISCPK